MAQTAASRLGAWGEGAAAGALERRGYTIVERNARTPYGEIDLVARAPDGLLVFVEVKLRRSTRAAAPEEAIGPRKLAHLTAAAQFYADRAGESAYRVDAVAVQGQPHAQEQNAIIVHFENIAG